MLRNVENWSDFHNKRGKSQTYLLKDQTCIKSEDKQYERTVESEFFVKEAYGVNSDIRKIQSVEIATVT